MAKHNFSAGPSVLPQEVFKKAAEAVLNFDGIDLSILEISHRSKEFIGVMAKAQSLVKRLIKRSRPALQSGFYDVVGIIRITVGT